jgi:hypothetical protein
VDSRQDRESTEGNVLRVWFLFPNSARRLPGYGENKMGSMATQD